MKTNHRPCILIMMLCLAGCGDDPALSDPAVAPENQATQPGEEIISKTEPDEESAPQSPHAPEEDPMTPPVQEVPPETPPTPQVSSEIDTEGLQSFRDFYFAIPDGWAKVKPDRQKTKAMLLLDGTNWQNARGLIKVDVGRPVAPTQIQLAEGFANTSGGTVSPDLWDFDGRPGVLVSTSSTEVPTPRNAIFIYHNNQAYLLMASGEADVDLSKVLSHIRETWKWAPMN